MSSDRQLSDTRALSVQRIRGLYKDVTGGSRGIAIQPAYFLRALSRQLDSLNRMLLVAYPDHCATPPTGITTLSIRGL